MKSRLQRILSILCVLALAIGCCSAISLAEGTDAIRFISVEWEDENNYDALRPASVDMTIGGKTVTLKDENNWTDEAVAPATAEWTAATVEGYTAAVRNTDAATIVTYTHTVAKTTATGTVAWVDSENAAGLRPVSVELRLLADGEPFGAAKTVNAATGWSATWDSLPVTPAGKTDKIVYTVEAAAAEGYAVSASGLTVTETILTGGLTLNASVSAPEGADVSGLSLTVTGPDPQMPVTLTLSQLSGGAYDFGQVLPGAYVLQENNADTLVEGYVMDPAASQVGDAASVKPGETAALNFKYTYREPVADEPNEDPMASAGSLSIQIDGPDSRMPITITYAEFKDGKYELDGLVPGTYSVIEKNAETLVRAYTLTSDSVTGMNIVVGKEGATATLFNQYVPAPTPEPEPELIDIPVTKTWNDNNNEDGNRPASITVRLYADGTEVDNITMSEQSGWTANFLSKPRAYEDGTEIKYTVGEDPVEWYTAVVNGYNITNNYNPEVTSLTVTKVWNDNNNELQYRPTSLAVTLMPVGKVYVLTPDTWTLTVDNLPTKIGGQPVEYYWTEQESVGYVRESVEVVGNATTFTNRLVRVPEPPKDYKPPKKPGGDIAFFEEYPTALGVEVYINHVGDCFD